jgi:Fe-S-cluster containining protein
MGELPALFHPADREVKECTGECCRKFPVNDMSSVEITEMVLEERNSCHLILGAMLVPLHEVSDQTKSPLFTCRHWDTTTKRCLIYNYRPVMCRDYPYGMPCKTCGGGGSKEPYE